MRKSFVSSLLILLACFSMSAQIKGNYLDYAGVAVVVRDSTSKTLLPGATVFAVSGEDTLKMVTPEYGWASYRTVEFRHTPVELITSYVGFKTRRDTVDVKLKESNIFYINLEEDPMELSSLIITADAVAMVMRGDTTVFNAAAFKTMKGDALRSMLEALPGVEVGENGVKYNGQTIDRILFNGNNLFGKDMGNAMDMVMADEVKSVEVYEKTAVDDLNPDSNDAKERVMDVHTWKPLQRVGQLSDIASAGIYTSEKPEGGHEIEFEENVFLGNYTLSSKPRVHGGFSYAKNPATSGNPSTSFMSYLDIGKDIAKKGGYTVGVSANSNKQWYESSEVSVFSPSEIWNERTDRSSSKSSYGRSFANIHGYGYMRHDDLMMRMNGSIEQSHESNNNFTVASSVRDGAASGFERTDNNGINRFSASFFPGMEIYFNKKRRKLSITPNFMASVSRGDGKRLDTLQTSMSREWLTSTLSEKSLNPSLSVGWNEPFGEKASLVLEASSDYKYTSTTKLWTNMFTGGMDINNSKDYTQNFLTSTIDAAFIYGRMNDGFYSRVFLGVRDILDIRDERMDNVKDWLKNYVRPVTGIEIAWSKGENNVSLSYSEHETVPMVEQLRNAIDDTDPLFLSAGRPDLDLSVCRRGNIQAGRSFPQRNLVTSLSASAAVYSNSIQSKTTYFATETWLEEYQYMAPAGSSLTTPENISGHYDANVTLNVSKYITKIKSDIRTNLIWNTDASPYFIADVLHVNGRNSLGLSADFSHRGEKNQMTLIGTANLGRQKTDGEFLYDYFSFTAWLMLRQRFGEHITLTVNANNSFENTTMEGLDFNSTQLNINLLWMFGKERRNAAGIFCNDLLNSRAMPGNYVQNDIVSHTESIFLGRCIGVSFAYYIMKR